MHFIFISCFLAVVSLGIKLFQACSAICYAQLTEQTENKTFFLHPLLFYFSFLFEVVFTRWNILRSHDPFFSSCHEQSYFRNYALQTSTIRTLTLLLSPPFHSQSLMGNQPFCRIEKMGLSVPPSCSCTHCACKYMSEVNGSEGRRGQGSAYLHRYYHKTAFART